MSDRLPPSEIDQPGQHHHSYLLRLWRSANDEPWRITLQGIDAESQIHFESVEHFTAFLRGFFHSPEPE